MQLNDTNSNQLERPYNECLLTLHRLATTINTTLIELTRVLTNVGNLKTELDGSYGIR